MDKKLIWFCGTPSSGKSTMALRLHLELEWAEKRTVLLDDEIVKRVVNSEAIGTILRVIGQEYEIIVSPYPQVIPRKPDLIVWCRAPLGECIKRDKTKEVYKDTSTKDNFEKYWGNYSVEANLILDTYDGRRETKENIEFCWQQLKRKVEELFGNISWRVCSDNESDWASKEPGKQYPF